MKAGLVAGGRGAEEHLSEEELDDVLIGAGTTAATEHVTGCAACAGRVEEFRSVVATFNQASLLWSEAKSNTLTRDLFAGRRTPARFGLAAIGSVTAVVTVAVMAVALSTGVRLDGWRAQPGAASVSQGEEQAPRLDAALTREEEIAGDNAMLQAINMEISRPEPSPEQVYSPEKAERTADRLVGAAEVLR